MNNNIEENRVNFTNSKLLKEKGYKVYGYIFYSPNGKKEPYITYDSEYMSDEKCNADWNTFVPYPNKYKEVLCSAPTTALVISWIRENFDIHISLQTGVGDKIWWSYQLIEISTNNLIYDLDGSFDTPQEAENAAIHHILTNLI